MSVENEGILIKLVNSATGEVDYVDAEPSASFARVIRAYCDGKKLSVDGIKCFRGERNVTNDFHLPAAEFVGVDGGEVILTVSTLGSQFSLLTGWAEGKAVKCPRHDCEASTGIEIGGRSNNQTHMGIPQRDAIALVYLFRHYKQIVYFSVSFWRKLLQFSGNKNLSQSGWLKWDRRRAPYRLGGFFGTLFPGALSDRECLQEIQPVNEETIGKLAQRYPAPARYPHGDVTLFPSPGVAGRIFSFLSHAVYGGEADIVKIFLQDLKVPPAAIKSRCSLDHPYYEFIRCNSVQTLKLVAPLSDADFWSVVGHGLTKYSLSLEVLLFLIDQAARRPKVEEAPSYGADPQSVLETALCEWVFEGRERTRYQVVDRLLKSGARADAIDDEGNTLLHKTDYCSTSVFKRFLSADGVDVNQVNKAGQTPLHKQSAMYNAEVVEALLENGADARALTALTTSQTALHIAINTGCLAVVRVLWHQGRGHELVEPDGSNLHWAAHCDYVTVEDAGEVLKWILEQPETTQAMACAQDKDGNTPLHVRRRDAEAQEPEVFATLVNLAGKNNLSVKNNLGEAPLHCHLDRSSIVVVREPYRRILEQAGADAFLQDHSGRTCLTSLEALCHFVNNGGFPEGDFTLKDRDGRTILYNIVEMTAAAAQQRVASGEEVGEEEEKEIDDVMIPPSLIPPSFSEETIAILQDLVREEIHKWNRLRVLCTPANIQTLIERGASLDDVVL